MKKYTKYQREAILASPEFEKYQPDFLSAVLSKDEYTMTEARAAVKAFFEKE